MMTHTSPSWTSAIIPAALHDATKSGYMSGFTLLPPLLFRLCLRSCLDAIPLGEREGSQNEDRADPWDHCSHSHLEMWDRGITLGCAFGATPPRFPFQAFTTVVR